MNERRCLKATVYLYLPNDDEIKEGKLDWTIGKQYGTMQLYDEHGNRDGEVKPFGDVGQMTTRMFKQYRDIVSARRKRAKNKQK